jgi:peptidoglycan/xylan/chitin deacetylase (PgdA/CDA1 family)
MALGQSGGVVVLMYHRLGRGPLPGREAGEEIYAVAEEAFAAHMALLERSGCSVVPLERVAQPPAAGAPARAVALTFDDGNASDFHRALPVLRRHGYPATFFVTPAWVGSDGYMTWDEVRRLMAAGMAIGAHGLDHTLLSTIERRALRPHLEEARRAMETELGTAPSSLSLPGGAGGRRAIAAAHEAGFELVATSAPRLATPGDAREGVPRFAVRGGDSLAAFRALVERRPLALLRRGLRHRLLAILRRTVGEGAYARLRGAGDVR